MLRRWWRSLFELDDRERELVNRTIAMMQELIAEERARWEKAEE